MVNLRKLFLALDRYWSITDITYVQNRTPRRIFSMLAIVWVVSLLISVAPIFGWKDADCLDRVKKQHVCLISQQISYQVLCQPSSFSLSKLFSHNQSLLILKISNIKVIRIILSPYFSARPSFFFF